MLEDVLEAVQRSCMIQQVVVVSSDYKVREFASNFGAKFLPEKTQGLNQAVEQAIGWCVELASLTLESLDYDAFI